MGVADFAFYLFAITALVGGLMTVVSKNPVHSVLWLVGVFLSSAGLFVLLGAEFVAMLMIIVYVGAVMVLFLFVVMMLDVDFEQLRGQMAKFVPLALFIGVILLMDLSLVFGPWEFAQNAQSLRAVPMPDLTQTTNTEALGLLIYTHYIFLFQVAGLILLVAMIGAIVLTLRRRKGVKRQNVVMQMHRDPAKAMQIKHVKPGQGLSK